MRRGHLHSPGLRHTHTHIEKHTSTPQIFAFYTHKILFFITCTRKHKPLTVHTHTQITPTPLTPPSDATVTSSSHASHVPPVPRVELDVDNCAGVVGCFCWRRPSTSPRRVSDGADGPCRRPKSTSQRSQICTFFEVPPSRETENSSFTRG